MFLIHKNLHTYKEALLLLMIELTNSINYMILCKAGEMTLGDHQLVC